MINQGNQFQKEELSAYMNELLANHCMPTLLKAKPSSLIIVDKKYISCLDEFLCAFEHNIACFNCRWILLCEMDSRLFLLVYNEDLLYEALVIKKRQQFLSFYGYDFGNNIIDNTFRKMQHRYMDYWASDGKFPHEFGIILGYPLADVKGFINNHGQNYLFCGMWKVYEEAQIASRIFTEYRQMKDKAQSLIVSGTSLIEMMEYTYSGQHWNSRNQLNY